mgnify:CR=1 FL=1
MNGNLRKNEERSGLLFVLPQIIGLILFILLPLIIAIYLCFCEWDFISAPEWVGLANFKAVFGFDGDIFAKTLENTGVFLLGVIPLTMFLALGLALLANQHLPFLEFYKSALFMPMVTSSVAIAMVWYWLFAPDIGLINFMIEQFQVEGPGWLSDPKWARVAIIIMTAWLKTGYYFIVFLAGLKGISRTYYEAAELDGASAFQRFIHITMPQLSPVTFFVFVMLVIDVFNMFSEAYVLTRGGPMYSTYTLIMYIYTEAMHFFNLGKASVASIVLVLFAGTVSGLQFYLSKKWVNYDT